MSNRRKIDKDVRFGTPYKSGPASVTMPVRIRKRAVWRTRLGVRVVVLGMRILPPFLRRDVAQKFVRGLQ